MIEAPSGEAGVRLLIIDDEEEICRYLCRLADMAGYNAGYITDPAALSSVSQLKPEVIILDLIMPNIDGVEVLRRLSELGFTGSIILASGYDRRVLNGVSRLAAGYNLTVLGILEKPIRAAALLDILNQYKPGKSATNFPQELIDLSQIRRGLRAGEFVLHYQPQVSLRTGQWTGIEALIRWNHPTRGMLYPASFMHVMEREEVALSTAYYVIDQAIHDYMEIIPQLGHKPALSINLPPAALIDVNFPDQILRRHRELDYSHIDIVFEVTETSVAANPVIALDILSRLCMKGFKLSLDDFGTGHSSLLQLQQWPFKELKIDMTFIQKMEVDHTARVIVEKSIGLGRELGLTVVAEGIESKFAWHWLQEHHCDLAQGYYIAKPTPLGAIDLWLNSWQNTLVTP